MSIATALVTTTCDWRVSDLVIVFSIGIVMLGLSAAVFGGWLERAGPRKAGLAAALCVALPASAQSGPPRPEIGEPRPFELPESRTVTLDNGLEMTFIRFGLAPLAETLGVGGGGTVPLEVLMLAAPDLVITATMSKALGSQGGVVVGPDKLDEMREKRRAGQ